MSIINKEDLVGKDQLKAFSNEIDKTFIRKEEGKDLSSNDFTDDYKDLIDMMDKKIEMVIEGLEITLTNDKTKFVTIPNEVKDVLEVPIGSTITDFNLSYKLSKRPSTIIVDGEITHTKNFEDSLMMRDNYIVRDTTISFEAIDRFDNMDNKNININFINGIYYGTELERSNITSEFINSLKKVNTEILPLRISVTANDEEYVYIAVPSRINSRRDIDIKYGMFTGGFKLIKSVNVTNNKNYTESFDIYKSVHPGLGELILELVRV